MKVLFHKLLKSYLHMLFKRTRIQKKMTQAQMAELLEMDLRSYSNIDNGKSMCSTQTFILFLLRCQPDMDKLMGDLADLLKESEKNSAA